LGRGGADVADNVVDGDHGGDGGDGGAAEVVEATGPLGVPVLRPELPAGGGGFGSIPSGRL